MTAWAQSSVGEVCEVIAGQSPASSAYNERGEGLPFYQGKKDFTDRYLAPPSTWTTAITKIAVPNDILMSVRAPVGPINVAQQEVCIGRGLAAIRAGSEIDNGFLWYALLWLQPKIVGNAGAVFPSINKKQIEALPIPLPPLEEQKRIVVVLDQAFAVLDRARALAEANLADAEELKATAPRLLLDEVDEGWEQTTIGQSCEFYNGKAHEKDIDEAGEFVVVNSKFISTEGKVRKYTDKQMFPLEADDIVMVMSDVPKGKALAKCYVIEQDNLYSLNQRICCIKSNKFVTNFLYHQINRNPYLLAFDNKGSQANLRKAEILSCPLWLPPYEQQAAISNAMSNFLAACRNLTAASQRKLADIEVLRQSILQKAFSGGLT